MVPNDTSTNELFEHVKMLALALQMRVLGQTAKLCHPGPEIGKSGRELCLKSSHPMIEISCISRLSVFQ